MWLLSVPPLALTYALWRYVAARLMRLPVDTLRLGVGKVLLRRGVIEIRLLPVWASTRLADGTPTAPNVVTVLIGMLGLYLAPAPLILLFALTAWPVTEDAAGPPMVAEVMAGSAAEAADIAAGDRVVAIDGVPIENVDALRASVAEHAGTSVVFAVEHDDRSRELVVTIPPQGVFGVRLQTRTRFGLSAGEALTKVIVFPAKLTATQIDGLLSMFQPSHPDGLAGPVSMVRVALRDERSPLAALTMLVILSVSPMSTIGALLQLVPLRPCGLGVALGFPRRRRA